MKETVPLDFQPYKYGSSYPDEKFDPHFHSEERVSSVTSGVLNLMSTILGGGVLSLPYAIRRAGLIPGFFLILIIGAITDFSLYILVSCGRRLGVQSIEQLAHEAFGWHAKRLCTFLVISVTYLPLVAYIILLRDLISPVVEYYWIHEAMSLTSKNILAALSLLLIGPACVLERLNSLKILCLVNIVSVLVLIPGMVVRCIECNVRNNSWMNVNFWPEDGMVGFLQSIPILICCYVCHFNMLSVHNELERPTRKRVHKIIHYTVFFVTMINMVIALSGFSFGMCAGMEGDNILTAYNYSDGLINIGRIGLISATVLSFPLLVVPCRDVLAGLYDGNLFKTSSKFNVYSEESCEDRQLSVLEVNIVDDSVNENIEHTEGYEDDECTIVSIDDDMVPATANERFVVTAFILVSAMAIAAVVEEVSYVWGLLGSTANIFIAFCLPAAAYAHIRRRHLINSFATVRFVSAWILLVVSLILSFLCTAVNIYIILEIGI